MSLSLILSGFAGFVAGALVDAITKKKKMRELQDDYDRCYHSLSFEVAVVAQLNRQIESIKQEWHKLKLYIKNIEREKDAIRDLALKYELLHADGHNNLRWIDHNIPFNEYRKGSFVAVVGSTSDGLVSFIVKLFSFDPNDPEDRDFAIREAEELIEIINKF